LSKRWSGPRGAGPPEPPQIIAQGEEEAAEAKERDNAPGGLDLGEVHEEELADDNEERCHTAPNEGGAVEAPRQSKARSAACEEIRYARSSRRGMTTTDDAKPRAMIARSTAVRALRSAASSTPE